MQYYEFIDNFIYKRNRKSFFKKVDIANERVLMY